MKKLLLLLLTISFFSISSNAQSVWTEVYTSTDVKVEMMTIDCNPNDRMVPYTYSVLRYTNKTNSNLDFNFEMSLWYNGVEQIASTNDVGDSPLLKTIQFTPNQVIEGDCSSDTDYLKVFHNNNNPKIPTSLTSFKIVEK